MNDEDQRGIAGDGCRCKSRSLESDDNCGCEKMLLSKRHCNYKTYRCLERIELVQQRERPRNAFAFVSSAWVESRFDKKNDGIPLLPFSLLLPGLSSTRITARYCSIHCRFYRETVLSLMIPARSINEDNSEMGDDESRENPSHQIHKADEWQNLFKMPSVDSDSIGW